MRMNWKRCVTVFGACLVPGLAPAAPYFCGGHVHYLHVYASGDVAASFTAEQSQSTTGKVTTTSYSSVPKICNIETAWNSVSPLMCLQWVSFLKSANFANTASANYIIYIYYDDATQTNCNAIASYPNTVNAPARIMLGY